MVNCPSSQPGFSTGTPWDGKICSAACCRIRLTPTVTSRVSSGPAVHPLDDADLQQEAEQSGDDERDRQRDRDRQVAGVDDLLDEVGGEGADHEELAVGHVDHAHLAEGEREAERGEQEQRTLCAAVQQRWDQCVHVLSLSVRGVRWLNWRSPGTRGCLPQATRNPASG